MKIIQYIRAFVSVKMLIAMEIPFARQLRGLKSTRNKKTDCTGPDRDRRGSEV